MPKTKSRLLLTKYPFLQEISEEEWDDFFPNAGKPWTHEEDEYLRQWYSVDSTSSIAYALGRTPWAVADRAVMLHVPKEPVIRGSA